MKKLSFLMIVALVMAACSNNDELLDNKNLNAKVTVTATPPGDAPDSRVALTEATDGNSNPIIKVSWKDAESFSVIRGTENKTYSKTEAGNTFTGDAHTTGEGTYYAFYPANENATATDALPYNLSTQTGALDETKTYMYAKNETDGKNYEFRHLTALVKFTLALPEGVTGVTPTKVVISSGKLQPVGTVNLAGNNVAYTPTAGTATSIKLTPTSLEFYAYVTPMSASGSDKNTFVISMDGSDGRYYSGTLETSKSIEAQKLYDARVDMIAVARGSLAMKNGSFKNMTADEISALSDDEKSEVAGIVFWTEDEEGSATLASDLIMKKDYPNCTHGLIVALTNVGNKMWQEVCGSVISWQNNNNYTSPYKDIASSLNNDDNIKYILGYQNTKILKVFNQECEDISKVIPVERLASWKEDNPDITGTTGWFIPSAKELHILCYKDDNDLLSERHPKQNIVVTDIDPLIEALGGDELNIYTYHSSSEYKNGVDTYCVSFKICCVKVTDKSDQNGVRAVCAF